MKHLTDEGGKFSDEKLHIGGEKNLQDVVRKVQLSLLQVMAYMSSILFPPQIHYHIQGYN